MLTVATRSHTGRKIPSLEVSPSSSRKEPDSVQKRLSWIRVKVASAKKQVVNAKGQMITTEDYTEAVEVLQDKPELYWHELDA